MEDRSNIIQEAIEYRKQLEQENAELKAYMDVNEDFKKAWEELKAENEKLRELLNHYQEEAEALRSYETYKIWLNNEYKKENDTLKSLLDYEVQKKEVFEAENERLKEEKCKFKEYCTCKAEKYVKCLQEIKKYIAKICKEECGYVQKKRCPDCDCRYGAILDLITKAEK